MQKHHFFIRFTAIFLILTILTQFLTGCSENNIIDSSQKESFTEIESLITTVQNETSVQTETVLLKTETTTMQTFRNSEIFISDNWEDYIGNLDAFVYGLMLHQYQMYYSTFDARITLSDGTDIFGIGYTDYAEYFESENIGYFPAGFIALIGEPEIPAQELENALEIQNLDYPTEDTKFLYAYESEPYLQHCVIWGEYLQYGVDTSGRIYYTAQNYEKGIYDKALGSLYSYDDEKYLYDTDVGNYVDFIGESLSEEIDYDALEAEVNHIMEEQDFNFSRTEIKTTVHLAQETMISYLLSLQEETFLGVEVSELVRLARELDPMECIQITPDGMIYVKFGEEIPDGPDAKTKWLVGGACVIVVALSIILQVAQPEFAPLTGAASSAAIEIFMQVFFENQNLKDINWKKVVVAAVIGGISGAAEFGLNAAFEEECLLKIACEISVGTLSSGAKEWIDTYIDGGSQTERLNALKLGIVSGALGSAISVGISKGIISKVANTHPTNTWKKIPDTIKLDKLKLELGKKELSEKVEEKLVEEIVDKGLIEKIIKQETLKMVLIEIQHEINPARLLKAQIKEFLDYIQNQTTLELLQNDGEFSVSLAENENPLLKEIGNQKHITEIKFNAGIPDLSAFAEYSFIPEQDVLSNRMHNIQNYCYQLSAEWTKNPDQIPEMLKPLLKSSLNAEIIQEYLFYSNLTFFENMDGIVYLIDKNICENIGYYGNMALTKSLVMIDIANDNFNKFFNTSPLSITGTLI